MQILLIKYVPTTILSIFVGKIEHLNCYLMLEAISFKTSNCKKLMIMIDKFAPNKVSVDLYNSFIGTV